MAGFAGGMEGLDGLIERLLEGRMNKGTRIPLAESEIRHLCITAKGIFLSQPNLLELEAPINVCGTFHFSLPFSFIVVHDCHPTYPLLFLRNLFHCPAPWHFRL